MKNILSFYTTTLLFMFNTSDIIFQYLLSKKNKTFTNNIYIK